MPPSSLESNARQAPREALARSSLLRQLPALFKLRIGLVISLTALAGAAVQPGRGPGVSALAVLFLAVLVASAAAGAFNQWWEADLDSRMTRTRARPFATGTLKPHLGWLVLIGLMALAAGLAAWRATNAVAAVHTLAGAFVYTVVYTVWLKRRSWWNIVVGGLAGSFAVMAGAAAVTPAPAVQTWLLALVLFLWTPPHFWSLAIAFRDDYASAGVPMLPVVKGDGVTARAISAHAWALLVLTVALGVLMGSVVTTVLAAGGGTWFVVEAVRLQREPTRRRAMRSFAASLLELSLVLAGVLIEALRVAL